MPNPHRMTHGARLLALELAGVVGLVWLVRRFDLHQPVHRRALLETGRLPREHLR